MEFKKEMAQYNHSNMQDLIRFIDQKAGAVLVIIGFILSSFIGVAKSLQFVNPFTQYEGFKIFLSVFQLLIGSLLLLALTYEIYILIYKILKPRFAKFYDAKKKSPFYFDHINQMEKKEFIQEFNQMDEEKIMNEYLDQVYELSKIYGQKTQNLQCVMNLLFISVLLLIVFVLCAQVI